jgi:excisionase family DNA binding protein
MPRSRFTLDGKTYLTTIEAAQRADLTREAVVTLVKQGRISARKHNGRWGINEASLDAFLHNRIGRPKRGRPRKLRFEPNSA